MSGQPKLSSNYMAALADVERRFPVSRWCAAGVSLWPLCRIRWMFAEWHASAIRSGQPAASRLSRLGRRASELAREHARLWLDSVRHPSGRVRKRQRRDVVFLSDGLSFARVGNEWLERFCDPLMASLASRGITSELWTPLRVVRWPRRSAARFVQSGVDVANLAAVTVRRLAPEDLELECHAEVCAALEAAGFGTASLAEGSIRSDASRLLAVANYYGRLLDRVRPRLVFIVSYYSVEGFAFVHACRQRRIPVVELQHGVQGPLHPAYAAWNSAGSEGHVLLPDTFWVWSPYEASVISQWAAGTPHRALVGGNPWLEVWREQSDWPGVRDARASAHALRAKDQGKPVVLVTLQFGLAPAAQLLPLLDILRLAGDRFRFWIRLHPAMLGEREQWRLDLRAQRSVDLDQPTDLPLHALLGCVDVHLTHSSSTVIEAEQFGVGSVLISQWGAELFPSQLAAGSATLATDAPAAIGAIDHHRARRGQLGDAHSFTQQSLDELSRRHLA